MSDSLKCFSVLEVPAILFREISINYGTGKGSDREGHPSLRELDSKKIGFSGTIQLERICKADTFKIFSKQIDEHGGGIEILGVKPILFLKGVKQPITVSGVDPRWPKLLRFSQSETEFLNIASPEIKFLNWLLPIVTQLACGEVSVEDIEWGSFEIADVKSTDIKLPVYPKLVDEVKDALTKLNSEGVGGWSNEDTNSLLRFECQGIFSKDSLEEIESVFDTFDGDIWELADCILSVLNKEELSKTNAIANLVYYIFRGGDFEKLIAANK